MAAEQATDLIAPENLRPAQLGVVFLGRVVLGHLSATIADLAHRGVLTVAEAPGDDWLLTDLRGRSAGHGTLLPFEIRLLDGLFAGGRAEVTLSDLGPELIDALDRTRRSLRRDAVRRGWLGRDWLQRLRQDRRTPRGEQLLTSTRQFRRELRALAASGDLERRPDLVPYAMVFGLGSADEFGFTTGDAEPAPPRDDGVRWQRAGAFGRDWTSAVAATAARCHHGHHGQPADFAHQWGVPAGHGHGHGNPGHDGYSGHGGHSDYGGYSGHGGFTGHDGGGFYAG
jgi:hypothetical protein